MIAPRMPNFRGHSAAVLHPADANRATLSEQLTRLGIDAQEIWPMPRSLPKDFNVIFFDADRLPASVTDRVWGKNGPPLIAITGTEAPGRLEAMLAMGPHAMLNKPLRRQGIFKALVFAYHSYSKQKDIEGRLSHFQEQTRARPLLFKTLISIMRRYDVGDDEAFAAVRGASMSSNMHVESFAAALLSNPDRFSKSIECELLKNRMKRHSSAV